MQRPTLRVETLVAIVSLHAIAFANGPWWSAVAAGRDPAAPGTWLFLGCTFVALVALHFVVLAAFSNRWTARPLLAALVLATAFAAYFMRTYSVMLDPGMLRNVLKTDLHETRELLSWSMAGWVLGWSAAPLALLAWVQIEIVPLPRAALQRLGWMAAGLAVAVLALLPISRDITSLMRNQHESRYLITPGNYLYSLARNLATDARGAAQPRLALGTDAHRDQRMAREARPRVLVMVLGETARADHFSLFGYPRPTSPQLASRGDVVAFRRVTACGTSTEVSVPCMFSRQGRAAYDEALVRRSEGLLDVLVHAGYDVRWFDNQSGCKGVCSGPGIVSRKLDASYAPDLCRGEDCYDGILVRALRDSLANVERDTVFVLHMIGNHGPAYYRRYPDEFRRFVPDCRNDELRRCSVREIVNAFDNALAYTDHVIAGTIEVLEQQAPRVDAAMLYVSDHGESLGEGGFYLHGLPYAIAPEVQTHVPMVVWASPGFARATGLDTACLEGLAGEPFSHDNLFDSMLGAADVRTRVYRPGLDLFARCRGAAPRGLATATATR
jgi:lipid A ethanolaminephosphotransferase